MARGVSMGQPVVATCCCLAIQSFLLALASRELQPCRSSVHCSREACSLPFCCCRKQSARSDFLADIGLSDFDPYEFHFPKEERDMKLKVKGVRVGKSFGTCDELGLIQRSQGRESNDLSLPRHSA